MSEVLVIPIYREQVIRELERIVHSLSVGDTHDAAIRAAALYSTLSEDEALLERDQIKSELGTLIACH